MLTTHIKVGLKSALDEVQLPAIDTNGLFIPKDQRAQLLLKVILTISEMFQASVDGDLYDPEKWGNFYKPYGVEVPSTAVQSASAPAQQAPAPAPAAPVAPAPAPAVETPAPAPVAEAAPAPAPAVEQSDDKGKQSADDILAMIRARSNTDA